MIIIWLILGVLGYFLVKIFRRPILKTIMEQEKIDSDLLLLIFMGLGVISLLAAANFILKRSI